ncbi:hypothetical protein L6164_018082 [Bauhinia variegata]|uniref:Uncharacterized protein n=1 Tax=Bauhinia variegata TaxID=167791 RepID=A0ACB9NBS9_BAUVA|nr:hypothetical protein L6164_018082 [Bauhinia variegata]
MSLFQTLFNQSDLFDPFRAFFNADSDAQMDWKETHRAHIFEIDLPGLTKDDVKLELQENRVLHISAERRSEQEEEEIDEAQEEKKTLKWHCKERTSSGSFSKEFRLPEDAKVDEIKACMRDGVLTITVPKDEKKKKHKQHQKKVEIYGDGDEGVAPKGLGRFVCCKA